MENPANRQKGKTSKVSVGRYFKYAIGEIILVVIGILIALSINNWNENRKLSDKRQELIVSLIEDFEYNKSELKKQIKSSDSLLNNMNTFNKLIANDAQLVSVDSLRQLARSFFRGPGFSANLTAYKQAESTGNLGLLENKTLIQEFTKFIENYNGLKGINEESRYAFFNGSSWEFRKTVDLNLVSGALPLPIKMNYADYKAILDTPLARAALNNSRILFINALGSFRNMVASNSTILDILNDLITE